MNLYDDETNNNSEEKKCVKGEALKEYWENLTPSEVSAIRILNAQKAKATRKKRKKYDYDLKRASQAIAQGIYCRSDGENFTIKEMALMACWQNVIKTGDAKQLDILAKLNGDRKEEVDINVGGIESYLSKVEDKNEY